MDLHKSPFVLVLTTVMVLAINHVVGKKSQVWEEAARWWGIL